MTSMCRRSRSWVSAKRSQAWMLISGFVRKSSGLLGLEVGQITSWKCREAPESNVPQIDETDPPFTFAQTSLLQMVSKVSRTLDNRFPLCDSQLAPEKRRHWIPVRKVKHFADLSSLDRKRMILASNALGRYTVRKLSQRRHSSMTNRNQVCRCPSSEGEQL